MHEIRVSVVIPCYNAEAYIKETVLSVLNQTFKPYEIIVVNDGSTDNTREILESFGSKIRIINQENRGDCSARNRGIEEAKGDWIAFLDADDLWLPDKLYKQVEIIKQFQNAYVICIHTGFYLLFPDGKKEIASRCKFPSGLYSHSIEELILNPFVNSSTAVVKKDVSVRFPEGYTQAGDMLFFAQLSMQGKFYFLSEPLAYYRQHPAQMTKNSSAWIVHFKNRFRWIEENIDILGEERAQRLKNALKQQIIHWLNLAKWNRQWERYFLLKEYALSLDWPEGLPSELQKKLYPRFLYSIKDFFDKIFGEKNEV